MGLYEQRFLNNKNLIRTNIEATENIAAGLVAGIDGGICDETTQPLGIAPKALSDGDEIVVMDSTYEEVDATTGGVVTAGETVTSDASGKVITAVNTGTFVLGIALTTSTGADETIKVKTCPVYYWKAV